MPYTFYVFVILLIVNYTEATELDYIITYSTYFKNIFYVKIVWVPEIMLPFDK